MVKPPKIRHSKPRRDPVTIDLDPADVRREAARTEPPADASEQSAASVAKPESAKAGSQPAAGTSPSKAETPESTAAKPAEGSEKASASKPAATGSSPATAGSKDDKVTSPGADTSGTASASAGGKDDRMTTSKSATIGSTSTTAGLKGDKDTPPKPATTGSTSASATGAKDDRKPSGPSVPETKPAPEAKPATATAGAATAGAATSVPPSGKPDPGKTAAPGASTPIAPKPAGDAKEPPTFGRGAATGPQKTDRKDEPAPAPVPPRRDPSRHGGVSAIAAGIVGAAVALVGAGALQYAGVLPAFQTGGADGSDVAELRTQIDSLREEIAAAGSDGATADTARVDELASGLEQIRTQIADLQAAPPEGGGADTEALQTRLSELESTVASLQGTEPGSSPEDLATIRERVSALEGQVSGASDAATAAQGAVAGLEDRLASLETSVQELSGRVEEQASDTGAALAIAAAGLKSAIDRGDPFMTELETFAAVAPDAPEVAALRDLAATGVPTRTTIAAQFDEVAARMIAAAEPVAEDTGYFGRLLDSMGSLVSVRPIGEVEGEGVGPTVARMEAAIDAGDYERAIAEYESLPEAAKAAGADYIAGVRARQSADDLVSKALAGALRA